MKGPRAPTPAKLKCSVLSTKGKGGGKKGRLTVVPGIGGRRHPKTKKEEKGKERGRQVKKGREGLHLGQNQKTSRSK